MVREFTFLLKQTLARIFTHSRPWLLQYCMSALPAILIALVVILPVWKTIPAQGIAQRDLDIIMETLMHLEERNTSLLLPAIMTVVACLAWFPVQIANIWLEGGALFSYTSPKSLSWKVFLGACNRWIGFLLVFRLIGTLLAISIAVAVAITGLLVRMLSLALVWIVVGAGLLLIICLSLWLELASATAVVRDDRRISLALRAGAKLFRGKPVQLIVIIGGAITCAAGLLGLQRWVSGAIPITWWLLSFFVLQTLVFLRHGLRLLRRSGEVVVAQIDLESNAT